MKCQQNLVVGGAAMVLAYNARLATHDVDGITLFPKDAHLVHELARQMAQEMDWPADWLNDGAKGYLVGISQGPVIFSAPGILVRQPIVAQLLAMKLCAWRDDLTCRARFVDLWHHHFVHLFLGVTVQARSGFHPILQQMQKTADLSRL